MIRTPLEGALVRLGLALKWGRDELAALTLRQFLHTLHIASNG